MIILSSPFIIIDEIEEKLKDIKSWLETQLSSINAMINEVKTTLNTVKTETAKNNTANATGTLSQKLTYIAATLLGTTTSTGGSATSGTMMAKLNELLKTPQTSLYTVVTGDARDKDITVCNVTGRGEVFCVLASYANASITVDGYSLSKIGGVQTFTLKFYSSFKIVVNGDSNTNTVSSFLVRTF